MILVIPEPFYLGSFGEESVFHPVVPFLATWGFLSAFFSTYGIDPNLSCWGRNLTLIIIIDVKRRAFLFSLCYKWPHLRGRTSQVCTRPGLSNGSSSYGLLILVEQADLAHLV